MCAWLEERGGDVRWSGGKPSGRSWENWAALYGAVTGMERLAVAHCQSGCAV